MVGINAASCWARRLSSPGARKPRRVPAIGRRGDLQHPAHRLDPVDFAMFVHEPVHHFNRRSSSAWAKKRAGQFQDLVGLAQFTVLALEFLDAPGVSRGYALSLAGINLVLLDPRVQGLGYAADLGSMDSIAAHCDGYSPRCSCTMRTARSRSSGENFGDFLMAPFSQAKEPSQNPGRFREPRPRRLTRGSAEGSVRLSSIALWDSTAFVCFWDLRAQHTPNGWTAPSQPPPN